MLQMVLSDVTFRSCVFFRGFWPLPHRSTESSAMHGPFTAPVHKDTKTHMEKLINAIQVQLMLRLGCRGLFFWNLENVHCTNLQNWRTWSVMGTNKGCPCSWEVQLGRQRLDFVPNECWLGCCTGRNPTHSAGWRNATPHIKGLWPGGRDGTWDIFYKMVTVTLLNHIKSILHIYRTIIHFYVHHCMELFLLPFL